MINIWNKVRRVTQFYAWGKDTVIDNAILRKNAKKKETSKVPMSAFLTPSLKARWVTWSTFLSSATVAGGLTYYETRGFPVKKM